MIKEFSIIVCIVERKMNKPGDTYRTRLDYAEFVFRDQVELLDNGCCLERKGTSTIVPLTDSPTITVAPFVAAFRLI